MNLGVAVLLLLCAATAQGNKSALRCNWARILKNNGMNNVGGVSLANWVCLVEHESGFNPRAINKNRDGSTDYGLFQINSKYWCTDGGVNVANGCGVRCTELYNVATSITCAKRVVRDPNGIRAWVGWRTRCQGRDLSEYTEGCDLQQ